MVFVSRRRTTRHSGEKKNTGKKENVINSNEFLNRYLNVDRETENEEENKKERNCYGRKRFNRVHADCILLCMI